MLQSDGTSRNVPSHPEIVSYLLKLIYVDDIVTGANSEEEALELYLQSKRIFHEASFNLQKFRTNSRSLQQEIDLAERKQHHHMDSDPPNTPSHRGVSRILIRRVLI